MNKAERTHNYPAKNTARDTWIHFCPASLSKQASGLYLPGPENLELSGYRKKGIDLSRWFGAEQDESLWPLVEANAGGVRIVRGNMQAAVKEVIAARCYPLSVVHMDFDGSYGTFVEQIFSVFTVFPAKEGWLCVTSYSARDEATLLQGMVNTSKFYSGLKDLPSFWEIYGIMFRRHVHLKKLLDSRVPDYTHLTREIGFLWWIALILGVVSRKQAGLWTIDRQYLERVGHVLAEITARAEQILTAISDKKGHTKMTAEVKVVRDTQLADILDQHRTLLWPESFAHYVYYTSQRQPMRVWMFKITEHPSGLQRPTHQELLEQVWRLARRAPLVYIDEGGTEINIG